MSDPHDPPERRSETDRTITELNQGKAERVVLGKSPLGTIARIVAAAALFILVFGTVFYFAQG